MENCVVGGWMAAWRTQHLANVNVKAHAERYKMMTTMEQQLQISSHVAGANPWNEGKKEKTQLTSERSVSQITSERFLLCRLFAFNTTRRHFFFVDFHLQSLTYTQNEFG